MFKNGSAISGSCQPSRRDAGVKKNATFLLAKVVSSSPAIEFDKSLVGGFELLLRKGGKEKAELDEFLPRNTVKP